MSLVETIAHLSGVLAYGVSASYGYLAFTARNDKGLKERIYGACYAGTAVLLSFYASAVVGPIDFPLPYLEALNGE